MSAPRASHGRRGAPEVAPSGRFGGGTGPPETRLANPAWFDARLSQRDFQRVRAYVEAHVGIRLPDTKRIMVETRLRPRLRDLEMGSYSEYCDRALGSEGDGELIRLIDEVTTNKTDFFREPDHYAYLAERAWPTLVRERGAGVTRALSVWSAGCASGEEPYTLAMVLSEVAAQHLGWRFSILATDISSEALAEAERAIYAEERIRPVPAHLRTKYLLQSKDREHPRVRITPALRSVVRFRRLNLMDAQYGIHEPVDVIFCRNVLIYFDEKAQGRVVARLCEHLSPGGYVFLGHSENINRHDLPLEAVAPSTYRLVRAE